MSRQRGSSRSAAALLLAGALLSGLASAHAAPAVLNAGNAGQLRQVLSLRAMPVTRVDLAGNALAVAWGSGLATYRLDAPGEPPAVLSSDSLHVLALSPDGGTIAFPAKSGLDVAVVPAGAVGQHLLNGFFAIDGRFGFVRDVALSARGQLHAGGDRGEIAVADAAGEVLRLTGHQGAVLALDLSPDGRLASGGEDGTVRTWQRARGTVQRRFEAAVTGVRWSPRGDALAVLLADGQVGILTLAGRRLAVLPFSGHAVTWSADGARLAVGRESGEVALWNPASGSVEGRWPAHAGAVLTLDWQGARLATGGVDGRVHLWDAAASGLPKLERTVTPPGCCFVGAAAGGDLVAVTSSDGTVRIWEEGEEPRVLETHGRRPTGVAAAPSGDRVAVASALPGSRSEIRLYRRAAGSRFDLAVHQVVRFPVRALAFSADGESLLVSVGLQGRIVVLSVGDLTQQRAWNLGAEPLADLAVSPDGARLALARGDGALLTASYPEGARDESAPRPHRTAVASVAWSADGQWLAGGELGAARLWPAALGPDGELAPRTLCPGEEGRLWSTHVLFTKGADLVICGSDALGFWRVSDGLRVARIALGEDHPAAVRDLVLSSDGRSLYVVLDTEVQLWQVAEPES